jgi:hypothetical protein
MRTPEEKLLNPRPGSKIAEARDYGIDLTLLVSNLRLTPEERLRMNDDINSGLEVLAEAMRKAKQARKNQ